MNHEIELLTPSQWEELCHIVSSVQTEKPNSIESITTGDTQEDVITNVIRFLDNRHLVRPEVQKYTDKILTLFTTANVTDKVSKAVKDSNIRLRRLQANLMKDGAFIGKHTDIESHVNYKYTVVLRLNSNYTGGQLIIYNKNSTMAVNQQPNTAFLMDATLIHEVLPVLSGNRNSLIALFG